MIAPAPGQAADVIKASPVVWSISGEFDGGKEAKNISGAACAVSTGTRKSCLLVSDEKLYARFFDITGTTISLKAKIPILPAQSGTQSFKETDGEGVDFDQGRYYVIGSHGTSKNHGDYQASRFFIYRFSVDAATGMPAFPITGDDPAKEVETLDRLEAILTSIPMLRDYACTRAQAECKSLQEHGINIEGVAVRNGSIYLGFRAPSLDGAGFIVRVAEDAVFGDAPAAPQVSSSAARCWGWAFAIWQRFETAFSFSPALNCRRKRATSERASCSSGGVIPQTSHRSVLSLA